MDRNAGRAMIEADDRSNEANFVLGAGLILSYWMICLVLLSLEIIDLAYYSTFLYKDSCFLVGLTSLPHRTLEHWYSS